jgi:hypothetical protein
MGVGELSFTGAPAVGAVGWPLPLRLRYLPLDHLCEMSARICAGLRISGFWPVIAGGDIAETRGFMAVIRPDLRLQEERRKSRRTVADVLEVVRQETGVADFGPAHVETGRLRLPSGQCTWLVDIVFPRLGCRVSLPTSSRFKARRETTSQQEEFEISRLDRAEIRFDGSVRLSDGTQLRAIEVIPTLFAIRTL